MISHTCTWPTQRSRDHCLHAHMCVLQKHGTRGHASWCLTAHADLVVMFDCVTSHRCVLQTHADMCVAEGGAVVTWLRVVSSRTNTHTHLSHACAVCGISIEPRPWSVIAHTHMCAAEESSPWSSLELPGLCAITRTQPRRSKGLRPRCHKRCFCDVRAFVVAQRCLSGSRNPWSRRLRFVNSVSGV